MRGTDQSVSERNGGNWAKRYSKGRQTGDELLRAQSEKKPSVENAPFWCKKKINYTQMRNLSRRRKRRTSDADGTTICASSLREKELLEQPKEKPGTRNTSYNLFVPQAKAARPRTQRTVRWDSKNQAQLVEMLAR